MLKTSYPQKATAALLLWLLSFNVFASTLVYQNNGNETTYSETTIGSTGSTTTLNSGGDTTLDGAIVQGKHVKADVGGNLTINTPQDVSHYDSKQTSYGVGVSIPLGAGAFGVSGSYSNDKVNANTNTTQEIAGIYAGEGGYDIQVKGNTTLDAGVIASTAIPDKNQFTTSTLVLKDKANQSAYDANSVGLSASYSGKQTTTDANGNTVPKMITNDKGEQVQAQGGTVKGFGANLPSTMSASDDASSTTRAAISAGNIRITDTTAQQQLTGQTAEQTLASINHDTANNATLTNLYEQDKESIQTGFAIGKGLSQNFASFMNYMAKDMDSVAKSPAVGKDGKPIIKDGKQLTNQEAYQAGLELGDTVNKAGDTINYGTRQDLWGSGGTGNRIATALIGAYSGNVSNGASTLLQNTVLNVVRAYGATEIKHLADGFSTQTDDKGNPIPNGTSETVRGLLHAVAGCAGASATGGDCASAGLASAGTVAMNNAMTALLNLNPNDMTDTQKQAYSNLIGTLVAGVSTAVGGDAAAAQLASKVEVDNNGLIKIKDPKAWGNLDMYFRYVSGEGGQVSLSEMHLADAVKEAVNTPGALGRDNGVQNTFIQQVINGKDNFSQIYNFGKDLVWAMGGGVLSGNFVGTVTQNSDGSYRVKGSIQYSYSDEFKDPYDTFNWTKSSYDPNGVPYKVYEKWNVNLDQNVVKVRGE